MAGPNNPNPIGERVAFKIGRHRVAGIGISISSK